VLLGRADTSEAHNVVFNNPFMGMACVAQPEDARLQETRPRATFAVALHNTAVEGDARVLGLLRAGLSGAALDASMRSALAMPDGDLWNLELFTALQHLHIVKVLLDAGADPRAETVPNYDTPLTCAAAVENAAAVDMLCRSGADTEQRRWVVLREAAQAALLARQCIFVSLGRAVKFYGSGAKEQPVRLGATSCTCGSAGSLPAVASPLAVSPVLRGCTSG
jgi:hypothetical protein